MRLRAGIVIATAPLEAQDAAQERFQLFNECQPVGLSVVLNDDDGNLPELTEERVQTLAESRLRAARLFLQFNFRRLRVLTGEAPLPVLLISVDVSRLSVFGVVAFNKPLHDPLSGVTELFRTWADVRPDSFTGTRRSGADRAASAMQRLSESLDTFVLEYLRVNEESCTGAATR